MKKRSILIIIISAVILLLILILRQPGKEKTSDVIQSSPEIEVIPVTITPVITRNPEITEKPVLTEENQAEFTEGVRIKKYPGNYACFRLETPDGFQIVCDPYNIYEKLQPDIVTESHQDLDHADTNNLESAYELITEPGEYNFDEVSIKGYGGVHNKGNEKSINNIFVFDINGIKIAHFASQGGVPSEDVLNRIGKVDILLIQVFVNPNYNKLVYQDVDIIIDKLCPKIVIPEHGEADAGKKLAKRLDTIENTVDSGIAIITRSMLDGIEGIQIINLDNEIYE